MKMMTNIFYILILLMVLLFIAGEVSAEEFSIHFSATVHGETEPCG